jgi:glycosyltransferase involved in cell wall biosynthesis
MARRLAFIVSHPIQYYAPLYQNLAARRDVEIKVFFTWHAASEAVVDRGFQRPVAWDIPLTQGYDHELVANLARDPGTHHFFGLRNPSLVERVLAWKPDAVHITGWAWASHLAALRAFHRLRLPILFRGDSHLLDGRRNWLIKKAVLSAVYSWPAAFLATGRANWYYYKAFGVNDERLFPCPHSIDVARFAEPDAEYEFEAKKWREALGIGPDSLVILFAGKFEPKKNPLALMEAVISRNDGRMVLVMVGDGELQQAVAERAARAPQAVRILPFQNQSRMPIVYRLGDVFVLPSLYGETWGLAVNEALASNRPVLASNRVGCAADVITPECGFVFDPYDAMALTRALDEVVASRKKLSSLSAAAGRRAGLFDIGITAQATVSCLEKVVSL